LALGSLPPDLNSREDKLMVILTVIGFFDEGELS